MRPFLTLAKWKVPGLSVSFDNDWFGKSVFIEIGYFTIQFGLSKISGGFGCWDFSK